MESNKQEMVTYSPNQGGNNRWLTVTTLLLAVGAILKLVTPSVGGITPNWMIAMYCIAINLTRPTFGQAAGIGLVAGAVQIPLSKSAFPYGNLLSEPVGAIACALLLQATMKMNIGAFNLRPAITTFLSTVASGMTFITVMKLVLSLPLSVYLYAMMPVVFAVAVINMVLAQLLYFPAQKLFAARGNKA
ncbi:MAG: ABC transporter [Negativicutes bacterium]|nr:ABC transporter [Negativicutes bacterium]